MPEFSSIARIIKSRGIRGEVAAELLTDFPERFSSLHQVRIFKEGREFLEQPLWVKFGILVAAVIFLVNVSMTVLAGRKTAITGVLLMALWLLSLLWIFAFIKDKRRRNSESSNFTR